MQFKRPINTQTQDGVPVKVNSFQFLRAGKLVLSVKASEIFNGSELPPEVQARIKGDPLTAEELAAWYRWKAKHDKREQTETNLVRFRSATENAPSIIEDTAKALAMGLVTLTPQDGEVLWEAIDDLVRELKRAGIYRQKRSRGRPPTKIIVDEEDEMPLLPNFMPPGTPGYDAYEELRAKRTRERASKAKDGAP